MDQPVLNFPAWVDGRRADVDVYTDRIEWRHADGSGSGVLAITPTLGMSVHSAGSGSWVLAIAAGDEGVELRVARRMVELVRGCIFTQALAAEAASAAPAGTVLYEQQSQVASI